MQKREKILALALVVACVGWFFPGVWDVINRPINERNSQIESLNTKLRGQQQVFDAGTAQQRKMGGWKAQSLPANPQVAALHYQQWLTDLAEIVAGIPNAKVTPTKVSSIQGKTYSPIKMTITGEAMLGQVSTLLYEFYRADLLHRVVHLNLTSQSNEGNPKLVMDLLVEGLSLEDAPERGDSLFTRTELAETVDDAASSLTVVDPAGFPEEAPFRVRVDGEYLTVTAIKDNKWTVKRGVEVNPPTSHELGATVEYAPIDKAHADRTFDDYRTLLTMNPFAKPSPPYNPRIEELKELSVIRGTPWKHQLKLAGFDPSLPLPVAKLAEGAPAGLAINPRSAELSWTAPADIPAQTYETTVQIFRDGSDAPLVTETVKISLQEPNTMPVLAEIGKQRVTPGQTLEFQVSASDKETSADKLKYSLGAGAPAGATIDPASGKFQWAAADNVPRQVYEIPIQVTDDGTPPQTHTRTVQVDVGDDIAAFTFLVAAIAEDDERTAWLYDRFHNKRVVLNEGGALKYAEFEGQVTSIGRDFVLLEIKDEPWRLDLGDSLRSMRKLDKTAAPQ